MTGTQEGRFWQSRGNLDCRDPNLWHSTNGTATEIEVSELVAAFVRGLQPEVVVETGSYRGQTSALIGKALQANGHGTLYTIQNHLRPFRWARKQCRNLPVVCIHSSSLDWLPSSQIDFVFFDSNFESRLLEFDHFYPHMNSKTIVCWHDSAPHHPVAKHVLELCNHGKISPPLLLPTPRGVCFARVL